LCRVYINCQKFFKEKKNEKELLSESYYDIRIAAERCTDCEIEQ